MLVAVHCSVVVSCEWLVLQSCLKYSGSFHFRLQSTAYFWIFLSYCQFLIFKTKSEMSLLVVTLFVLEWQLSFWCIVN